MRLSRQQALRQLQECGWDVEDAQRQVRARMGAEGPHSPESSSSATPIGGLGMRLVEYCSACQKDRDCRCVLENAASGAAAKYFVVAKVIEHGSAFRSGSVHVGDRLLQVVIILLYMCPHTPIYLPSYSYICVLILVYM